MIRQLADNRQPDSLATALRRRRFALFLSLLKSVPRPTRILDVGGTQLFWDNMQFDDPDVEITILNRTPQEVARVKFVGVTGDARAMFDFAVGEFDVVFSNSVIEHLCDSRSQQAMASEVARVGRRYWVQTPNRYFPIEAHALLPMFQFLPKAAQVSFAQRFKPGWYRGLSPHDAAAEVAAIRLLTARELRRLFPGSTLWRERMLGVTKSIVVHKGFDTQGAADRQT